MLQISVDESFAFDFLAILEIKEAKRKGGGDIISAAALKNHIDIIKEEIAQRTGIDIFNQIYTSEYYKNIYNINLEVFEKIDTITTEDKLAKEINDLNYKRFIEKKKLQEKFFLDKISEQKIGYNI